MNESGGRRLGQRYYTFLAENIAMRHFNAILLSSEFVAANTTML